MSFEDKIKNAKPTRWPAEGLSKIQVRFIVITTKIKVRFLVMISKLKRRILQRINKW